MLNQVVLVGRLANDLELNEQEGKTKCWITLAIPRCYKNEEGIYETDDVKVLLYGRIASNTNEYCKKGDIIGVKGRVENRNEQVIVAEKVTFLSSTSK